MSNEYYVYKGYKDSAHNTLKINLNSSDSTSNKISTATPITDNSYKAIKIKAISAKHITDADNITLNREEGVKAVKDNYICHDWRKRFFQR